MSKQSGRPVHVVGVTFLLLGLAASSAGNTISVPGDYATIQAAIDAAVDGDTVLVADGTYTPASTTGLDLKGKAITVRSENGPEACIIDGGDVGRGFWFHLGEGSASVVEGFTITNGYGFQGGGIACQNSSATIANCTISDSRAAYSGGGIYCNAANPTITDCTISGNLASYHWGGGGISLCSSSPTIADCTITGNTAAVGGGYGGGILLTEAGTSPEIVNCIISENIAADGGGIGMRDFTGTPAISNCLIVANTADRLGGGGVFCNSGNPTITNCTIVGNASSGSYNGGGMVVYGSAVATATNCILWGDTPDEIWPSTAPLTLTYSDVALADPNDAWPGDYNINADPLFVDAGSADYHLSAGSPCVDAGNNDAIPPGVVTDLDGAPRIWCNVVDLGAHESTFGTGEPKITCPDDLTRECPADTHPDATGYATAIDGCTGDPITVSYSDEVETGTCPGNYVITRTWFVVDDPTVDCYQTITVVDTTAPVLTMPADVTIECDASTDPADTGEASATDTCDEAPAVTYSDNVVLGSCSNEWTITRTWLATDACDNSTSADQIITVVDTTAPELTVDSTPITAVDSDCSGDEVVTLPTATAVDGCDPDPTVTNDAPATFPAGETTTVTFTATDACGNSSTATVDVTVEHGASIRVHAAKLTLGWGWRPCITSEPLVGITVGAYDYSPGSCAYDQRWCGCWFCWTYLPTIVAECTPVNTAVTDENGWATINLPPGEYIIVSHFDSDGDGELDFYLGHRVWRHLDCGESLKTYLRMLVTARDRKLPGKFARLTGSELVIVEPEYVVWDEEEQLYPFGLEAVGDWEITASVDPPEGFVPDYDFLATDVEDNIDALQFTITEVGSDLVPTQTTFEVLHGGQIRRVWSNVDILLTPEYARSRGFNVAELRARGLIVDDADHVWSAVESQPVEKPVPAVDRPIPRTPR